MKVENRTITTHEIVYIANDGEEFKNETTCLFHEWKQAATCIYAVQPRGHSGVEEAYSTLKLAQEAVGNSKYHHIIPIYLDERFWDKE